MAAIVKTQAAPIQEIVQSIDATHQTAQQGLQEIEKANKYNASCRIL